MQPSGTEPADDRAGYLGGRDWRIWFGIVVTILWIIGGLWYVIDVSREQEATLFDPAIVGSFLEGAFAPLAFLWLVLGLFIQQRELTRNTEALHRTSLQSEKQTAAIAATEMNARQETFFKIADAVKHQLGGISGMLFVGGLGPPGSGRYTGQEVDELFSRAANGDCEVFARMFISQAYEEEGGLPSLLYDTEIRRRHTRNFQNAFKRLQRLARNCDVDGIIEDSLRNSAFGLLYRRMIDAAPEEERSAAGSGEPAA
ncbi:MAG: hypothetical protein R3315_01210 [Woeseiaceae bacterium]|nr:hypothetical protein [Woeseiaceae bacterium]